jgi:transposase
MKLLQEFTGYYWLSMAKITVDISTVRRWVIKSRDNGSNMDLNDQLQWGRPVSATHDLNMQNFDELIQENLGNSTPRLT